MPRQAEYNNLQTMQGNSCRRRQRYKQTLLSPQNNMFTSLRNVCERALWLQLKQLSASPLQSDKLLTSTGNGSLPQQTL